MMEETWARLRALCLAFPNAVETGGVGTPSVPTPQRYFVAPYVGPHDWVGRYLDGDLDWDLLADLVDESYRMTAPKRLVAQLAQP
jgi:hypothetical protein